MLEINREGTCAVITAGLSAGPNLLSIDVLAQLHRAVDSLEADRVVRAVVIKGAGERFFFAGADLRELARLDCETALLFSRLGQSLFDKMERSSRVFIAAVDGFCMGGGLDLLLACDLRYATRRSVFAHTPGRMGIITGFGGTVRLPAEVGFSRARRLLFTAEKIGADEAHGIGLLNDVVEPAALIERSRRAAAGVAHFDSAIVAAWKRGLCGDDSKTPLGLATERSRVF